MLECTTRRQIAVDPRYGLERRKVAAAPVLIQSSASAKLHLDLRHGSGQSGKVERDGDRMMQGGEPGRKGTSGRHVMRSPQRGYVCFQGDDLVGTVRKESPILPNLDAGVGDRSKAGVGVLFGRR